MGFAGIALLKGESWTVAFAEWENKQWMGYGCALLAAITWALYSVLSRKFSAVPTDVVGVYCGIAAGLGLICHIGFEETQWPIGWQGWAAISALGFGPMGLAFFAWDYGVKHGDIRALGVLSYAAPLLSIVLLIAFGAATASWALAGACFLIVGGAAMAGYSRKSNSER